MASRALSLIVGRILASLKIAVLAIVCCASSVRAEDPATAPKSPAGSFNPEPSATAAKPKQIAQSKAGGVWLRARDAAVHGKKLRYDADRNTLGYWTKPAEWVSWDLEITRPETFTVIVELSAGEGSGGSDFTVEVADQKLSAKVPQTGSFNRFRERIVGTVKIEKPGNYTLALRALNKPGASVMNLRSVSLDPPKPPPPAKPPAKKPAEDGQKESRKTP